MLRMRVRDESYTMRVGTSITPVITDDYEQLLNKPQINDVTLIGNKTLPDLGVYYLTNMEIEHLLT